MSAELRRLAGLALARAEPRAKVADVEALGARAGEGGLAIDTDLALDPPLEPGRPVRPALVDPRALPRRGMRSAEGRVALLHAVAHIEFNAINLALDAVARFAGLPGEFYRDWLAVAREEARHYMLVAGLLETRGTRYGALPAHGGLWQIARRTAGDALAGMALVPRLLEARGLDVTPGIRARLAQAGDTEAATALDVILADEIGHVATGNRWYRHLCAERGLDPEGEFERLRVAHEAPGMHPPFNLEARAAAGFSEAEMQAFAAANALAAGR